MAQLTSPSFDFKTVRKTVKLDATGSVNIFEVLGTVSLEYIVGRCVTATDSTTCTGAAFKLNSGVDITDSAMGTDLSGLAEGDAFAKINQTADALVLMPAGTTPIVTEGSMVKTQACLLSVLPGKAPIYLTFDYTGDKSTDIDIEFTAIYKPLTGNGEMR